jgi:hypothetical protein
MNKEENNLTMKKFLIPLFAIALVLYIAPAAHAASWVYLGQAHVDGQHDHDNIEVGAAAGRYRFLQIRVQNAPIEFDRIVVHYGDGEPETLAVRDVIRAGGHSRAIKLQGDRFVKSFELWYGRPIPPPASPNCNSSASNKAGSKISTGSSRAEEDRNVDGHRRQGYGGQIFLSQTIGVTPPSQAR